MSRYADLMAVEEDDLRLAILKTIEETLRLHEQNIKTLSNRKLRSQEEEAQLRECKEAHRHMSEVLKEVKRTVN